MAGQAEGILPRQDGDTGYASIVNDLYTLSMIQAHNFAINQMGLSSFMNVDWDNYTSDTATKGSNITYSAGFDWYALKTDTTSFDDFTDGVINPAKWDTGTGGTGAVVEQNNLLEFSANGGAGTGAAITNTDDWKKRSFYVEVTGTAPNTHFYYIYTDGTNSVTLLDSGADPDNLGTIYFWYHESDDRYYYSHNSGTGYADVSSVTGASCNLKFELDSDGLGAVNPYSINVVKYGCASSNNTVETPVKESNTAATHVGAWAIGDENQGTIGFDVSSDSGSNYDSSSQGQFTKITNTGTGIRAKFTLTKGGTYNTSPFLKRDVMAWWPKETLI